MLLVNSQVMRRMLEAFKTGHYHSNPLYHLMLGLTEVGNRGQQPIPKNSELVQSSPSMVICRYKEVPRGKT